MKTARQVLLAAWSLLVLGLRAAAADVLVLTPVRDNTLFEDDAGSLSNGAGPVLYAGNNGQDLARRALLRFDVASALPAGARIEGATLAVNVSNAPNTTPRTFTVHRVLRDWGEGASSTTSGSGAPAAANDATWIHAFFPGDLWAAPGGDFVAVESGAQAVAGVGAYAWNGQGLVADVQRWLDDPASNFGWLIRSDEVTLNTARRFDSRENTVAANRPLLTIVFTRTVGVVEGIDRLGVTLGPCRPHPAVGPVRVDFTLAREAWVRLDVLDAVGRRVATVLQGARAPGRHEARWEGRSESGTQAAGGIYFLRLVVDGRIAATRRLVRLN